MPTRICHVISSGAITSTEQTFTGACMITALGVFTDGSNDATVTIYDGTANTDKKIWYTKVVAVKNYGGRVWVAPAGIDTGIYTEITGTGAWAIVEYEKLLG